MPAHKQREGSGYVEKEVIDNIFLTALISSVDIPRERIKKVHWLMLHKNELYSRCKENRIVMKGSCKWGAFPPCDVYETIKLACRKAEKNKNSTRLLTGEAMAV